MAGVNVPSSRGVLLLVAALAAGSGCKKREKATQAKAAPPPPPPPAEGVAEPLPGGAPGGALGVDGAVELLAAADDGRWVLLCQREGSQTRLRVVVGDGPGLDVDRAVATSERDLVVVDGDALVHVDVVARTARRLGPVAPAAIHAASRRLIQVDGTKLIVRDPGAAPRTVDHGVEIGGISSRGKRWLEVAAGAPTSYLTHGTCTQIVDTSVHQFPASSRTTVDLDPSGLEAPERVGPELGITAAGEVTLDGATVVGADCVGNVVAALAEPPRALVMCNRGGNRVVGPGLDKVVGGSFGGEREQATISENLLLGRRVVCATGACIDLVTGRDFETYSHGAVWLDDRFLVRKGGSGLLIDDLDQERQRALALPRITQAVTVDTATGRRIAGAAPKPPAFIDGAGRFLLYGRHVIDVEAGTLVKTVADDPLAIDTAGRILVVAPDGDGPLRWVKP